MLIESPASKIYTVSTHVKQGMKSAKQVQFYRARTNGWEIDFSDVIADFGRKVLLQDWQACISVSGTARRLKEGMRMALAHGIISWAKYMLKKIASHNRRYMKAPLTTPSTLMLKLSA